MFGTDQNLDKKFHWFVGTSSGGIIALGLIKEDPKSAMVNFSSKMSPADCIRFYLQFKDEIFVQSSVPHAKRVDQLLSRNTTEETAQLKKVLKLNLDPFAKLQRSTVDSHENGNGFIPRIVVTALEVTNKPAKLKIFRNYKNENTAQKEDIEMTNIPLWKIALATSAAPTYFDEVHINENGMRRTYVDGGLSPDCSLDVFLQQFDEVYKNSNGKNHLLGGIISIGTGQHAMRTKSYSEPSIVSVKPVIKLQEQTVGSDGNSLEVALGRCSSENIPVLRINPENVNVGLDEVDDEALVEMLWSTQMHLCQQKQIDQIDRFAMHYSKCYE